VINLDNMTEALF